MAVIDPRRSLGFCGRYALLVLWQQRKCLIMGLVSELRRRNVFRMAVLYAVAAWLIMQVADVLIDLAKLPDWIGTTTLWLLAVGFPIALIFSWFYEVMSEGISLERDVDPAESITHVTGRRLDEFGRSVNVRFAPKPAIHELRGRGTVGRFIGYALGIGAVIVLMVINHGDVWLTYALIAGWFSALSYLLFWRNK